MVFRLVKTDASVPFSISNISRYTRLLKNSMNTVSLSPHAIVRRHQAGHPW